MFYTTRLHAGHFYICPTTQESQRGIRVPFDLDRAYDTKAQAEAARREAAFRNVSLGGR